jgi:pilus assembly protein CpaF
VHANSPRDALTRLEHMVGMTGIEIPVRSLRSQMASALNLVVQVQRLSDGRRRVVSVQEITGTEGDTMTMQELFRFERQGVDTAGNVVGQHVPTGIRPKFVQKAEENGVQIPAELFRMDGKS